jgi:hypothetical protein
VAIRERVVALRKHTARSVLLNTSDGAPVHLIGHGPAKTHSRADRAFR